ncbi:SGNH/GDSL hydrolase family protein [Paraburkholderia sp. BL10I2N1]|uniref:SGNH/GDSL hydrolase family protein n=1 Tax=Paraburkholderia sp. BL10I2N1 TaxID=1938796 RepID=UPI0010D9A5EB|nr:SGNH/GDSL hydrolase family protein [Paraburkholderia sp. BL10I2N1]TDN70085.1 lysophospholipase L1-like esterase [Paraburkholderia sp. BL10I2N1]
MNLSSTARATAGALFVAMLAVTGAAASGASRPEDGPHATGPVVLIEAYGDSTTLGISCSGGHCGPLAQNAVSDLQDALQATHGASVTVTNFGVGGTMAYQLRDGTERGRGEPWKARLAASRAQIVTINYGINEVMHNQTPEQFYAAETELVTTARALGKLPVLETSNPMPDGRLNAKLAMMAAMTRRVAAEQRVPLVDQFSYISALPDWKTMMSDGAHPKPELYRLKANQDFDVIDPLVRRMLDDPSKKHASTEPDHISKGQP